MWKCSFFRARENVEQQRTGEEKPPALYHYSQCRCGQQQSVRHPNDLGVLPVTSVITLSQQEAIQCATSSYLAGGYQLYISLLSVGLQSAWFISLRANMTDSGDTRKR